MNRYEILLSKQALKDLQLVPNYIALKLYMWIDSILEEGLSEVRKIKSYHDEPLKGKRIGQRSIRLSKAYRAIYIITDNKDIIFLEIIEVNKYEY